MDSSIRDLLKVSVSKKSIPFSVGLPSPDLLPLEAYQEANQKLMTECGPNLLLQSPTEGLLALREALVQWLLEKGINGHPDEILVLSGSQQGHGSTGTDSAPTACSNDRSAAPEYGK